MLRFVRIRHRTGATGHSAGVWHGIPEHSSGGGGAHRRRDGAGNGFGRLGQNAISGYLVAGTLIGPSVLNLVSNKAFIESAAELGVALVLFAIGLGFSVKRLKSLGRTALGGGTLQIALTTVVAAAVAYLLGLSAEVSIVLGWLWRRAARRSCFVSCAIAPSWTAFTGVTPWEYFSCRTRL